MPDEAPSRRERKKRAIREKIIEETVGLIKLHGIDGTTIEAICDCSDIAKKTFYNYYSSKHELLFDICQTSMLNRTNALVTFVLEKNNNLTDRLTHLVKVMKGRVATAEKLEKELIHYSVSSLADNLQYGAHQLTDMNDCFIRLYKANKDELVPSLNAEFCAEMTVGMINAITLNWLHNDDYNVVARYDHMLNYLLDSMVKETP